MKSRSVLGISSLSRYSEVPINSSTVIYHYLKSLPFSSYGEVADSLQIKRSRLLMAVFLACRTLSFSHKIWRVSRCYGHSESPGSRPRKSFSASPSSSLCARSNCPCLRPSSPSSSTLTSRWCSGPRCPRSSPMPTSVLDPCQSPSQSAAIALRALAGRKRGTGAGRLPIVGALSRPASKGRCRRSVSGSARGAPPGARTLTSRPRAARCPHATPSPAPSRLGTMRAPCQPQHRKVN